MNHKRKSINTHNQKNCQVEKIDCDFEWNSIKKRLKKTFKVATDDKNKSSEKWFVLHNDMQIVIPLSATSIKSAIFLNCKSVVEVA